MLSFGMLPSNLSQKCSNFGKMITIDLLLIRNYVSVRRPVTMFWTMINIIMLIFFSLATFVQHNDPDWYFWGTVYLIPAAMSAIQAFATSLSHHYVYQAAIRSCLILYSILTGVHLILYLTPSSSSLSSSLSPWNHPLETEEGREFLGSLIALLWIVISVYMTTTDIVGDTAVSRRMKMLIFIFSLTPLIIWFILYLLEIYLC